MIFLASNLVFFTTTDIKEKERKKEIPAVQLQTTPTSSITEHVPPFLHVVSEQNQINVSQLGPV